MMYFQHGKRKANTTIEVVNAKSQRKINGNLPTPTLIQSITEASSSEVGERGEAEANIFAISDQNLIDVFEDFSGFEYDSDLEYKGVQQTYKKCRERLSSNWEKIRLKLIKTSVILKGLLPSKCSEVTCQEPAETCCRDCGYSIYYCRECCGRIHKDKMQFHGCQILKVSVILNMTALLNNKIQKHALILASNTVVVSVVWYLMAPKYLKYILQYTGYYWINIS